MEAILIALCMRFIYLKEILREILIKSLVNTLLFQQRNHCMPPSSCLFLQQDVFTEMEAIMVIWFHILSIYN